MQEEKQLSGEESLRLINRMIHEAKGYFHESGIGALVYGFTTVLCCVLTYLRETGNVYFPFHPFYIMEPVLFLQGIIQFKEEKKKQAKTFTDEAIDFVWTGFFISALAALCAGFAGIQYIQVSAIIILAGLASYITGMLAKFRYLIITSFVCWGVGIYSFFQQNPTIYLLLAATATLIWVVPGFILKAHFKKQQHAG
jgi:hypothetical protein